jgi:hypothetical protein
MSPAAAAAAGMALFNTTRLSVQPVSKPHWDFILSLEPQEPPKAAAKPAKKRKQAAKQAESADD